MVWFSHDICHDVVCTRSPPPDPVPICGTPVGWYFSDRNNATNVQGQICWHYSIITSSVYFRRVIIFFETLTVWHCIYLDHVSINIFVSLQEHYTEVAHSTSVRFLDGKEVYLEFSGNLVPVTKSGSQPMLAFEVSSILCYLLIIEKANHLSLII